PFSLSARPAARTFCAALTSRSCTAPTLTALPAAHVQRLGAVVGAACGAGLRGGGEPADPVERPPVLLRFLADQAQQLRPSGVVNRFCEPGPGEPGHGQVL